MSQGNNLNYEDRRQRALRFFDAAYRLQEAGELEHAEAEYRRSVAHFPTAEGFTYLGWVVSLQGRLDEAIQDCRRAIELDSDFGNPYNDIGAYLIELGRLDEAVPYLKKAVNASRYECYFYAHYNLGRVWESKGMLEASAREYRRSLDRNAQFEPARLALTRVEKRIGA